MFRKLKRYICNWFGLRYYFWEATQLEYYPEVRLKLKIELIYEDPLGSGDVQLRDVNATKVRDAIYELLNKLAYNAGAIHIKKELRTNKVKAWID